MEIHILKENLSTAVALVSRFAAQKAQLPVLSHIVIEVKDKEISLKATDLDKGISLKLAGKVIEEGEIAVPAKVLGELVQVLPLGAVKIRESGGFLEVGGGKMGAKLQLMDTADFPEIARGADEFSQVGEFQADELIQAYDQVKYVVSRDESRPVLTGVLWDPVKGRVVATDGYRLSVVKKILKTNSKKVKVGNLLVSGGMWGDLVRVVGELGEGKVQVYEDQGQVIFKAKAVRLMGRLVEGEYPGYQTIIPKEFKFEVKLNRLAILEAVKAAAIFAKDSANIVKLSFKEKEVVVSANAPQLGSNEIGVELERSLDVEEKIAFNSRYLVDYLSNVQSEEVFFGMSDALQPGMFWVNKIEGIHVIMPVRVKGE